MKFNLIFLLCLVFLAGCIQSPKSNASEFNQAYADYDTNKALCQSELLAYTKKYPEDYKGWSLLGSVSVDLNKDSAGEVYLRQSLQLNPKDAVAFTELGVIERKRKHYQEAAEYYEKAIEVDSIFSRAFSSLMLIELKRENYRKAVELGERAVFLEPDALVIKAQLCIAYHMNGQFKERDSLLRVLDNKGYPDVERLKKAFDKGISLDNF